MIVNLTRLRLIAGLLCLLLLLPAAFLLWSGRIGSMMMHSPVALREDLRTFDVQEEPAPSHLPGIDGPADYAPFEGAAPRAAPAIAVTVPRIAYTYGYSFRLDRERIAAAQEGHLALCRRLGPALCRVTAMRRGGSSDADAGANLKLQVAAALAESFGRGLIAVA